MSYEKQLFETDDGEVYFVNQNGELFLLDFVDDSKNSLEEMEELIVDYSVLSLETKELRADLKKSAKEHGIEIKGTKKDIIDKWRERKNSKDDLTEDITSQEFFARKNKILQKRLKTQKIGGKSWLPDDEIDLDGEITETLIEHEEKEENKKSRFFLKTKPNYKLEC